MRGSSVQADWYLQAGEIIASAEPMIVRTILGSCVAVCLWDPVAAVGGMNHFLLPRPPPGEAAGFRHGGTATSALISEVLRHGAQRHRLQAGVFGGGRPVSVLRDATIAEENRQVAVETLAAHGIVVSREDTGGPHGRFVLFHTATGETLVRTVRGLPDPTMPRRGRDPAQDH